MLINELNIFKRNSTLLIQFHMIIKVSMRVVLGDKNVANPCANVFPEIAQG